MLGMSMSFLWKMKNTRKQIHRQGMQSFDDVEKWIENVFETRFSEKTIIWSRILCICPWEAENSLPYALLGYWGSAESWSQEMLCASSSWNKATCFVPEVRCEATCATFAQNQLCALLRWFPPGIKLPRKNNSKMRFQRSGRLRPPDEPSHPSRPCARARGELRPTNKNPKMPWISQKLKTIGPTVPTSESNNYWQISEKESKCRRFENCQRPSPADASVDAAWGDKKSGESHTSALVESGWLHKYEQDRK